MQFTMQPSRVLLVSYSHHERKSKRCRGIDSIPQLVVLFAATLCLSSLLHPSEAFSTTYTPISSQRHHSNPDTLFFDVDVNVDINVDPSFISLSQRSIHLHNSSKRRHSFKSSKSSSTSLSVTKRKPMPIVGYNGQEICDYYDRSPLVVGWRLNILSLPLLGMLVELLVWYYPCL